MDREKHFIQWLCKNHFHPPFNNDGDNKMAEYNRSKTIIPYLDRDTFFILLPHLPEAFLFPTDEIIAAQYAHAKGANMFDITSRPKHGAY